MCDFAGGVIALCALASALHERCFADPVLNHPLSQASRPDHLERLAEYLGEVFGGPAVHSSIGGHSAMLEVHASAGADDEMACRFATCFDLDVDDVPLPDNPDFRRVLHEYIVRATAEVNTYAPLGSSVPANLAVPRWSWDGLQ